MVNIIPKYNIPTNTYNIKNPTTSVLTATILPYTRGAGITAAAGTRLALLWLSLKIFKLVSF